MSASETESGEAKELIAPAPSDSIYDVAIIGSGPAGLTAAIYTTRAAVSTLVLAGSSWGGQLMLTTDVDNFPGFSQGVQGPELMQQLRKQAERFGAFFEDVDAEKVDFGQRPFLIFSGKKEYRAKSVIVATGAGTRWLGLPGEQRLIGRGVSSCAPCDAPFFKDKKVIVVGGGDSAMEEAYVLTKYAQSVTIVHRRDKFRASAAMQKKVLKNDKIKVLWNSEVVDILGKDKVEGVEIKNNKTGEKTRMPIDGVFVAIGHVPNTKIFSGQLALDEKGYIKIASHPEFEMKNEQGEVIGNMFSTMTSVKGVFAAGDVHDFHYRQAVTAAGFGCQAAMDCVKWLGF